MRKSLHLSLAAAAAALALAGCGGGGGGGTPAPAPEPLAQPKGFWNGPVGGADLGGSYARAVVLDDGRSWVFLHDGSAGGLVGLITAQVTTTPTTYAASGTRYLATGAQAGAVTMSGGAVTASGLQLSVTQTGGGQSTLALAADSRFATPARQVDVVGRWDFTQADQSILGTWTIDANGSLSGSRTSGCSYAGTVRPLPTAAVYEADLTEACPNVQPQRLSGIAKLNSAASVLTFGLSTAGGAQAIAFAVQKQN